MIYTDAQALVRAKYYLQQGNHPWAGELSVHTFKPFYDAVVETVRAMSPRQREAVPVAWAERFAALGGDFAKKIQADPLILYKPRTSKHAAVHTSTAFIRYLPAANTIGKSLLAYVEDIRTANGFYGFRGNVAVVSTGHTVYSEKVFIPKMITGDDGDSMSPYLPEGGKWLHSFDQRKYLARIACPECAEAGKTKECAHTKSIQCLSADSGVERLMGFAAKLIHVDEHIPEDVYKELVLRVRRGNVDGRMLVTATPLAGMDSWEVKDLLELSKRPTENWLDKTTMDRRYVEVFNISMYDCVGTPGGPTLGQIEALKNVYSPSEFQVRVMGKPMPLGDSIFNLHILDKMEAEECREAEYGEIEIVEGQDIESLEYDSDITWTPWPHNAETAFEGNYVWEHPQEGAAYVIGADVASGAGVTSRDASVAYVMKIDSSLNMEMVAAHMSFMEPLDYAREVKKLAIYYKQALVVPEINSIGSVFLTKLYRELSYPSIFLGETPAEMLNAGPDSRMGVMTSTANKPAIVVSLLNYIHSGRMKIRDKEAISECRTFQKTRTEAGNYLYKAANGARDDRVMSLGMLAYAATKHSDQLAAYALPTAKPESDAEDSRQPKKRKKFSF